MKSEFEINAKSSMTSECKVSEARVTGTNQTGSKKLEWQKPEVSVVDINEHTQNNFNGGGSDGKFFS